MKQDKLNIGIIIAFLSIIMLPQITFWFISGEVTNISISENRELSAKPEFKFATISNYPKAFDNYYNDNLPFRTQLRNIWCNLNYELFNISVDHLVVIGKNNWLFFRGDESIEQAQGILKYTAQQKNEILINLQDNIDYLNKKNIEAYVLIIPNKENIYREYLPKNILIKEDTTRTEDLIDYIRKNSNINIIYPKEELIKAKEKYQVYRKYDTHWNKIGSFIATISLQKAIDPSFSYDLNNIEIEELNERQTNDLSNLAGLNERFFEDVVRVKDFYKQIEYTISNNFQFEEFISNSQNNKTVLFIGDSFRADMEEYFSKLYKKVIYIDKKLYTENLLEEINPDIVIFESIERLSFSKDKKIF